MRASRSRCGEGGARSPSSRFAEDRSNGWRCVRVCARVCVCLCAGSVVGSLRAGVRSRLLVEGVVCLVRARSHPSGESARARRRRGHPVVILSHFFFADTPRRRSDAISRDVVVRCSSFAAAGRPCRRVGRRRVVVARLVSRLLVAPRSSTTGRCTRLRAAGTAAGRTSFSTCSPTARGRRASCRPRRTTRCTTCYARRPRYATPRAGPAAAAAPSVMRRKREHGGGRAVTVARRTLRRRASPRGAHWKEVPRNPSRTTHQATYSSHVPELRSPAMASVRTP